MIVLPVIVFFCVKQVLVSMLATPPKGNRRRDDENKIRKNAYLFPLILTFSLKGEAT
jgi:hypothetical protein